MPRKPEPSWEMKKQIIGFAAKEGQDNLSVIQRDIDRVIWKERSPKRESTPDIRTIKRIIKEFQMLDREIVVREFPSYVWKMRDDFEEVKAHQETEDRVHVEPKEFLPLLHRWREQAQFWALDEFLRQYYLRGLAHELQRRATKSKCDAGIYDDARRHHAVGTSLRVLPGLLPVVQEGLFHRLRQCYPGDAIWEAQDCWGRAYADYFDGFASWCADIRRGFERFLALASMDELPQDGREVAAINDFLEQRKADANCLAFLEFASLGACCDLLTLGMAALPPNPQWFLQVDKLQILRSEAVNLGTKLPGGFGLPQTQNQIGVSARLFWEHHTWVKEKTIDLLGKLQRLQAAQDDLHSKLAALELRLYDVTESQPP
jgi:hypothetical protein